MNKKKIDKGMIFFFQVGDLEKKTEMAAKIFSAAIDAYMSYIHINLVWNKPSIVVKNGQKNKTRLKTSTLIVNA